MRHATVHESNGGIRGLAAAGLLMVGSATAQVSWAPVAGPMPSARSAAAAVPVPWNGVALLFGGVGSGGVLGDTWGFNGATWTQFTPPVSPPPRSHHVMAPFDYHVILFGGRDANGAVLGDAWVWIANQFVWAPVPFAPPAREGAAFTGFGGYRSVLFGGRAGATTFGDTWICNPFSTQVWFAQTLAVSPPARHGHAMARFGGGVFGQSPVRIVLFGGVDAAGTHLDDTWIFDDLAGSTQWTLASSSVRPPARRGHTMVHCSQRSRVQLFGGEGPNGVLGDTWEWDGGNWVPMVTVGAPAPCKEAVLVEARQGPGSASLATMLVGGRDSSGPIAQAWWMSSTFPATTTSFGLVTPAFSAYSPGAWLGGSLAAGVVTTHPSTTLVAPHVIAGFSNTASVLGPLPLDLGPTFDHATLLVDPLVLFPLSPITSTQYGMQVPLPSVPSAAGVHVYLQGIAYVSSTATWGISPGIDCTLGWL